MSRLTVRAAAVQPQARRSQEAERRAGGEAAAQRMADQGLTRPLATGHPGGRPGAGKLRPLRTDLGPLPDHVPDHARRVLQDQGEALPTALRADLEPRLGHDFSQVRVHRDVRAAASAEAASAQAYTLGHHLVLGRQHQALQGSASRAVLAHELSHVVQQQAGHGIVLQRLPTELSQIAEADRRALQVGTIAVPIPAQTLTEFFTLMPSGRPSGSEHIGGVQNSFGGTVPAALQQGLGSVAAHLVNRTNVLPLNTTLEVDLDLSAHGGSHSTYRFTYFTHHTGRGRTATAENVMLIELLHAAPAPVAAQTAPSGSFSVNGSSFTLSGRWSDADYTVLHQALGLLPDAARTGAAGLTFRRTSTPHGDEAGRYLPDTDTVELNNLAFPAASHLRVGELNPAVRTVLHEVGHALDLRVLERAWQAFNSAGQSPAARGTFLAARSLSGTRYVAGDGGNYDTEEAAGDASPQFRAAVARDGVRRDTSGTRTTTDSGEIATLSGGPTRYADTNYEELYAEAFSLYMTAPETLRQLRPATYAYFLARFPRTGTATGTGSSTSSATTTPGGTR